MDIYFLTIKNKNKMKNQKYICALCGVQFKGETEVVNRIICLKPMEKLGIVEGDALDNSIFFYCKNYEEFLGLSNKDNGQDFVVRNIYGVNGSTKV